MTTLDRNSAITASLTWVALGAVMILVAGVAAGIVQYADELVGLFPELEAQYHTIHLNRNRRMFEALACALVE